MSTIRDILLRERSNRAHIYLYRRGLFYQAFNYSAYLFHHLVYPFEVTSHLNLKMKKRYYMVSFPIELLSSYPMTIKYDMTDGQLLRYKPSESAMASLPESYIRWCLRYTPIPAPPAPSVLEDTPAEQPEDSVSSVVPMPCSPPILNPQSIMECCKLSELLMEIEREQEPIGSTSSTAKGTYYDLTLDDKVYLCDWLVSRILKSPSQCLCPMDALKWLDKLQEELRDKLWHD